MPELDPRPDPIPNPFNGSMGQIENALKLMHLSYIIPITKHYAREVFNACQEESVDIETLETILASYANDVVTTKISFDNLAEVRRKLDEQSTSL